LSAWLLAGCVSVSASEPARLLVQPRAGLTLEQFDEILRGHGARRVSVIQQINVHVVELPPQADAQAVARLLKQNPHIESAEVDERVPPALP
jgi:thermitase